MVASSQKINVSGVSGVARRLVLDGALEQEEAIKYHREALQEKKTIISYLVEKKLLASDVIAFTAAQEFGFPLIDVEGVDVDPAITKLVKSEIMQKHTALPLYKRGKRLCMAVSDPGNVETLNEIKFATGLTIELVIAEADKLVSAIDVVVNSSEMGLGGLGDDEYDDLEEAVVAEDTASGDDDSEVDDAPVVRFVHKVMGDAISQGASDLHFEPYEKIFRVRFRIDGILREVTRPPKMLAGKIAARLKVMSRLDLAERRVPQDGRIKLKLSKSKSIDFRVSTCPTLFGEKICMRILDSDAAALQIDQLGYEPSQKAMFLENLHKPYGMFLVTGPTGSGKTVSLYTGINILNKDDVNISTAEDPVEINLLGVNQVQVDEKTGMTFPKALKAFLRQDPDIILVGEIRDINTAEIAVKAAQTGHMVMSTLHTNDGPQTLTRLQDMGIQAFAVATTINLITGQRLCRRLNPDHKVRVKIPDDALRKEGFPEDKIKQGIKVYGPGDAEAEDAYKGRAGIYQVMPISDEMKRLIIGNANAVQLADQSDKEGIWNIRRSGLQKVMDGVTSLEEVNRVTLE